MPKQSKKPDPRTELEKLQDKVAESNFTLTLTNREIDVRAPHARQLFANADDHEKERLVTSITDFIKDGDNELSEACYALGMPEIIYHQIRSRQQLRNFESGSNRLNC